MDNLANRLQVVSVEAPKREKLLEYDEYRFRLANLSAVTEERLKLWMEKLGKQEEVQEILTDYQVNFVLALALCDFLI